MALFEKAGLTLDNLPEAAMVNMEEDYGVCKRMLARAQAATQAPRAKGERQTE